MVPELVRSPDVTVPDPALTAVLVVLIPPLACSNPVNVVLPVTPSVPTIVVLPAMSTFSLDTPPDWKFKKSAAEPAPVLGAFSPK